MDRVAAAEAALDEDPDEVAAGEVQARDEVRDVAPGAADADDVPQAPDAEVDGPMSRGLSEDDTGAENATED